MRPDSLHIQHTHALESAALDAQLGAGKATDGQSTAVGRPLRPRIMTKADSAAAESIQALLARYPELDTLRLQQWAALQKADEDRAEADSAMLARIEMRTRWTDGLPPVERTVTGVNNSGLTAMLVTLLIVVILCLRNSRRLFANMGNDLIEVRSRARNFDEHTATESRLVALFGLQLVVYLGMMLQAGACVWFDAPAFGQPFSVTLRFIAVSAAYYVFQLMAYATVGYAFTDDEMAHQWMRGFNASQALLGFALALPALVTVFYPDAAVVALITAAVVYIIARLIYIIKGFRIFYTDFTSLLYFILYLCTLEVIPPLMVAGISFQIGSKTLL